LGSLYEKAGSSAESIRHHQGMVDKLVECGIQVNLVRSVLEKALRDPAHRRKLHLAAKHTLRYEVDFTATNEDLAQLESYKLEVIEAMDDSELVDALIMVSLNFLQEAKLFQPDAVKFYSKPFQ
jgi:hypothetical protein